jgi:hypothetical protein
MEPPARACYTLQARTRIWNISCLSYFTCSEAQKQRARRCHNSTNPSQGGPISPSTLQGRYYLLWLSSLKYAFVGFELQARGQTVRRRMGEHSLHSSERGMPFHVSQCHGNIIIGLPAPAHSEVQNMGCSFLHWNMLHMYRTPREARRSLRIAGKFLSASQSKPYLSFIHKIGLSAPARAR